MTQNWIILGAGSGMARAFIRRLAEQGAVLFLAGRRMAELADLAEVYRLRGAAAAEAVSFDARDAAQYGARQVSIFTPAGFPCGTIKLPKEAGMLTTNLTFRDDWVYVVEASKDEVWRVKVVPDSLDA